MNNKYWEEEIETMPREQLRELQLQRLKKTVSVVRPLKELKHFTKVEVEPDETVQVEFVITPDDLKFFDEASHRWIAEPGVFNVYVGTSSADIRCMHSFKYICD